MSHKGGLDKQKAEFPWTARQKRAKNGGRGSVKRGRKMLAVKRAKAR